MKPSKPTNESLLAHAPYPQLLLKLCLPSVVIILVLLIYNMADTYFIGQTGDAAKLAAVSLCSPLFTILSGLGTLLGSGGCTAVSIALGKKETGDVKAITAFCCYGALLLGFLFLLLVLFFLSPLVSLLGAGEDTLAFACTYLRIIACGAPLILFSNVFANVVRSDGSAIHSMIGNLSGTLTNLLLDALFILGFSWGVAGAALATVLGNVVTASYLLFYIKKKQPAFSLCPKDLRLRTSILLPVLTLGLPLACGTILMSVSSLFANRFLISYGTRALAAQNVSGKIGMVTTMLSMGICLGLQPAVSYNYGCKNQKRVLQILKNTGIFTVLLGILLTGICFFARNTIIRAFIDDTEILLLGQNFLYASLVTGPVYGLYQLCQLFLQATGKASYATLVSTLDKGIFYLPILFLLHHIFGMYGVVFATATTFFFSLAAAALLSLRWYRKLEAMGKTPTE